MSINCIALGKRICFYRLKFNITQEKLAALTNCSREYIAYLESGTKTPSLPTLIDLANVLHIPNRESQTFHILFARTVKIICNSNQSNPQKWEHRFDIVSCFQIVAAKA